MQVADLSPDPLRFPSITITHESTYLACGISCASRPHLPPPISQIRRVSNRFLPLDDLRTDSAVKVPFLSGDDLDVDRELRPQAVKRVAEAQENDLLASGIPLIPDLESTNALLENVDLIVHSQSDEFDFRLRV